MKNVILMGFMGAGKTTVGKTLAKKLGCDFLDTDELIEQQEQCRISEIFDVRGEAAFRALETELLKKLQKKRKPFVLSIGGGMPVREENRGLLKRLGTVVYLKTSRETILKRVAGDKNRPLLQGGDLEQKVEALMHAREDIYRETATAVVWTDDRSQGEVAEEIAAILQ